MRRATSITVVVLSLALTLHVVIGRVTPPKLTKDCMTLRSWRPYAAKKLGCDCILDPKVVCNEAQELVTELYLDGQALGPSTIPSSWNKLKELQVLNLAGNNLTGTIPKSWGVLSKLTMLDISGNKLTKGPIPSGWYPPLMIALDANALCGHIPAGIDLIRDGFPVLDLPDCPVAELLPVRATARKCVDVLVDVACPADPVNGSNQTITRTAVCACGDSHGSPKTVKPGPCTKATFPIPPIKAKGLLARSANRKQKSCASVVVPALPALNVNNCAISGGSKLPNIYDCAKRGVGNHTWCLRMQGGVLTVTSSNKGKC